MVYAKTKNAAGVLSAQLANGKMKKIYQAVVCGKLVDNVENYVDYVQKAADGNYSQVVDKGITDAKRAELSYEVMERLEDETYGPLGLIKIRLKTGRHHQIRVQMSAHGFPLYGDTKYNPAFADAAVSGQPVSLALCASSLSFIHPSTGKQMEFSINPSGGIFEKFR
jgi:23S rRNA pseudouridine1911/1915/1917 synthase